MAEKKSKVETIEVGQQLDVFGGEPKILSKKIPKKQPTHFWYRNESD